MTALSDEIDAMIAEHGGRERDALNIAMAQRDVLRAELADVRAQWQADVGSAIARAQTAEARARAMELERAAARAEAARLRSALITYSDAREMVLKALPASIVNETEELWGVTNTQLVRRALSYLWHCAALRGPAQSE